MALKISNEKDTVSIYGDVARRVLNVDGIEEVVGIWLDNLSNYAEFISMYSILDNGIHQSAKSMAESPNSTTVSVFLNRLNRLTYTHYPASVCDKLFNPSMPISYTLYYDIIDDKIVFTGVPDRTILLLNEDFSFLWSNLTTNFGKAIIEYIVYPTNKNFKQFKEELLKRIKRRVKSNYKKYITDGLSSQDSLVGNFACGEVLSSDISGPRGPRYFRDMMVAIERQELLKTKNKDLSIKNAYNRIISDSNGDYSKLRLLDQTEQLMNMFVNKYGHESIIDYYFKEVDELTGEVSIADPGKRIINQVSKYMPDDLYSEYLIHYINELRNRYDDEDNATSFYSGDISSLYGMLEDERSKGLIDSWGGLYTTRYFPNAYYLRPHYTSDHFGKYNLQDDNIIMSYISDNEYDKINQFINTINKSSVISDKYKKYYNQTMAKFKPYSELVDICPSLPSIEDIPNNYVYVPKLMTNK